MLRVCMVRAGGGEGDEGGERFGDVGAVPGPVGSGTVSVGGKTEGGSVVDGDVGWLGSTLVCLVRCRE